MYTFTKHEQVTHPLHGLGVVTEVSAGQKLVTVLFSNGNRSVHPSSLTPDRIKVTEEELVKLVLHTSDDPDRYLNANFGDGTISTSSENSWAFDLLAEWRGL